jgi:hypothetical protein
MVLGAIPDAKTKTGLFSYTGWVLVVTDQRLLGAHITNEIMKHAMEEARAQAKASGSGFFGQWGAQLKASVTLGRRYCAMTPEAILAETPGNWAVVPGQVRSIKVEDKERQQGDGTFEFHYLKITLETVDGKVTYETNDASPNQREAQELLARTFGPAVK